MVMLGLLPLTQRLLLAEDRTSVSHANINTCQAIKSWQARWSLSVCDGGGDQERPKKALSEEVGKRGKERNIIQP